MRCPNCGWMNASGQTQCEKCDSVLGEGPAKGTTSEPQSKNPATGSGNIVNSTVIGQKANLTAWDDSSNNPLKDPPKVEKKSQSRDEKSTPHVPPPSEVKSKERHTQDLGRKDMLICPSCRYMNVNSSNYCVSCGAALLEGANTKMADSPLDYQERSKPQENMNTNRNDQPAPSKNPIVPKQPFSKAPGNSPVANQTVNPWSQRKTQSFILKPVAREGEQLKTELLYEGNSIILNRENLEPPNTSITSKIQATIEFREGTWYVMNGSEQQTTFIRIEGAMPLKKGDVLLLGDRLFEFDCD